PSFRSERILKWLVELLNGKGEISDKDQRDLAEFFSLTCLEVVKREPSVLLGEAQTSVYLASLPTWENGLVSPPPDPEWARPILAGALNLNVSIADQQTVAKILAEGLAKGRSQEDITEELIDALRPDVLEIQAPQDYLRQISVADVEGEHDKFAMMRDGLFY